MEFFLFLAGDATFYSAFLKLAIGLLLGIAMGLTGVGGGILIIPLLQFVFGMEPVLAVGTASLIASLVKVNASIFHIKAANVDWRSVKGVLLGAVPVGIASAFGVVYLSRQSEYNQWISNSVQVLIIAVMFFALYLLAKKYVLSKKPVHTVAPTKVKHQTLHQAVLSGGFCGLIIGTTGIGGGVLLLPILNSHLGIGIKKSVGSSIVIALVLSASTSFIYAQGGQSDIPTALMLVLGSLIGVPIATTLLKQFSETTVYLVTLSVICVSILIMMLTNMF
ncbi:sulfite exporter TauE/SafE family protein [Vibrio sp. S9_S30]|uniref:sulfite exporter TauE/SafE family protein n=1 Tax=Vibrio sp. S9_S30 TaxID=2720226 RepID=UPI001680138D|nr:sulfite exporter TauE/SafE family protein [Vibrio sp. S9_S30]MBD1557972.1 sulfite exporter TauE/SafE family protein [Vibrio sp. S9_S30]